jgi:hypothetical protein
MTVAAASRLWFLPFLQCSSTSDTLCPLLNRLLTRLRLEYLAKMGLLDSICRLINVEDRSILLTALTSTFTLTPSSSPLFTLLTLPALLHRASNAQDRSNILKKAFAMAFGSTGGSLITTYGLLPFPLENITMQALVSTITALYIGAILRVQRWVVRILGDEEHWLVSPMFGAIWAAMWLIWARLSPFGRFVSRTDRSEPVSHQGHTHSR